MIRTQTLPAKSYKFQSGDRKLRLTLTTGHYRTKGGLHAWNKCNYTSMLTNDINKLFYT